MTMEEVDNIKNKFRSVLGAAPNKDILAKIMALGGVHDSIMTAGDPNMTAYRAGRRDLALAIIKLALKEEIDINVTKDFIQ
jgi:hypothetical protein